MKRRRIIFILLAVLLVLFSMFSMGSIKAAAEEESGANGQEELLDGIGDLLESLDTEELQKYLDSLSDFRGISVKDKLLSIISGDFALDYSSLFGSIFSLVWEEFRSLLPAFAIILAVAILCGVLNSAKISFLQSNMSDIVSFVGYLAIGSVTLSCLIVALSSGYSALNSMRRQAEIVYPILLTLMAASGGAVSAAVFRPAVAFFSGGVIELFSAVVFPCAIVVIVLGFVGNLTEEVKTEKLADLFKSIVKWISGLALGLFGTFLTVQGLTAAQYDGLSLRAAKYAISSGVPMVGGFLSGGVDIVLAGSAIIKNALGSFSVFLLLSTLLKPLVVLVGFQLLLRLSAAACEPLDGKFASFLSKTAGNVGYFIAGLLLVSFVYFITLLLLICSSGVIF